MNHRSDPALHPPADLPRQFILVVDDEQRIADTLATILAYKGYRSEAVYDASTALARCAHRVPDLLITDVVMPGMNGVDLAIAVTSSFPSCRILLFSGQAATAELLDQAGTHGYRFDLLAKPVHPVELLERVAQLVGPPGDTSSASSAA